MRIACVIHSLAGGGAERLMAGLVNRLVCEYPVTLITLDQSENDRYPVSPQVQRICLGAMKYSPTPIHGLWNNLQRLRELKRAVLNADPDVVLSFCDKTNVLTLAALRGLSRHRHDADRHDADRHGSGSEKRSTVSPNSLPIVISEHTDPRQQHLGFPWEWLRRRFYPLSTSSIVLTSQVLDVVQSWTGNYPAIIPPAIDLPADLHSFSRVTASEHPTKRILALGRLSKEKGFDRAIEAFAQIARESPDWNLTIAGDGAEKDRLVNLTADFGISDRVEFVGWVNGITPFLRTGDIFVLPSHYEGFPVALLEAMSHGLACVAFDCPCGPSDIIVHELNGLLVPRDDVPALAKSLAHLIASPQLRSSFGDEATKIAATYSWTKFVDAHLSVLKKATRL